MSLPGTTWLGRQLESVRGLGGDYQSYMGSPVRAGAVFAMSVVLVAAWLVSLPFLLVWAGIAKLRAPQGAA